MLLCVAGGLPNRLDEDEGAASAAFGAAAFAVFPNKLGADAPDDAGCVDVFCEAPTPANRPPPVLISFLSPAAAAPPNKLPVAGTPAGVVEFIPNKGLAGVAAVAGGLLAGVVPNIEEVPVPEAGALPKMPPPGCEVGVVPAAGVLLSLLPNKLPELGAVAGGVELAAVEAGVDPKIPPEAAGFPAAPKRDALAAGCCVLALLLLPEPKRLPLGVLAPEAGAAPNSEGFASAGFAAVLPNRLPGVVEAGVVEVLLPLPALPKEKPEPDCPPNRLPVAGGVLEAAGAEPNSEPEAGADEVVALFDWPAELALPKVKDMMGAPGCS